MNTTCFETDRLILKPTSSEDAQLILMLLNTPKWLKYIGDRNVRTIYEAKEYINTKMTPQLERLGYANYTVIHKSSNEKLGICGLYDREGLDGIDIGFAFLPEYENKGYAYEAANKVKQLAFDEFEINEIKAITTKDNLASQKILEKLGMKTIGLTKIADDLEEVILYRLKNNSTIL
jgi:[ribosomal protein S5]-alanine N-acetyltransferase